MLILYIIGIKIIGFKPIQTRTNPVRKLLRAVYRQSCSCGALANLFTPKQGREGLGHAFKRVGKGLLLLGLLFQSVPVLQNIVAVVYLYLAENMWVAVNKLLSNIVTNVIKCEIAQFGFNS